MTSTLPPLTATAQGETRFRAWFMARRARGRRDAARAEAPEVISSWCNGTTLVEVVNHGGIDGIETIETPNSPTCGGGGETFNFISEDGADRFVSEDGNTFVQE